MGVSHFLRKGKYTLRRTCCFYSLLSQHQPQIHQRRVVHYVGHIPYPFHKHARSHDSQLRANRTTYPKNVLVAILAEKCQPSQTPRRSILSFHLGYVYFNFAEVVYSLFKVCLYRRARRASGSSEIHQTRFHCSLFLFYRFI